MQELKSDLVSASGTGVHVLRCQIDVGRGKEGFAGLWGGRGGVIPTKTWLWSVLIERKNVLADRPFQRGHLEVLEQLGRTR